MFISPLFLFALVHAVEPPQLAPQMAPQLVASTQFAAHKLQSELSPPICESPRAKQRGTGLLLTGLALATQGYIFGAIGRTVAIEDNRSRSSGGEDFGYAAVVAGGAGLFAAASYTASLTVSGIGAHRRGRWNGHGVRCSNETRLRPRPLLGLSLAGAGMGVWLANAFYAYNYRPRCERCHAVAHHTGSFVGLSMVLSGVTWTAYSAGFRR
jgi:hypothetical protein